jgi:hypothetical protein
MWQHPPLKKFYFFKEKKSKIIIYDKIIFMSKFVSPFNDSFAKKID